MKQECTFQPNLVAKQKQMARKARAHSFKPTPRANDASTPAGPAATMSARKPKPLGPPPLPSSANANNDNMVSAKDNLTSNGGEDSDDVEQVDASARAAHAARGVARSDRLYEEAKARERHKKELFELQMKEQAATSFKPQREAKNSRWERTQNKKDREFLA